MEKFELKFSVPQCALAEVDLAYRVPSQLLVQCLTNEEFVVLQS